MQNPEAATKTLTKVAKAIAVDKRMLVGQVLVKVAAVDHVITKTEFQVLERVFRTFELPLQKLSDLMLQVCPSPEEPTVQEAKPGSTGETIPAPETSPGFALDMVKVYAITNETKEVVGILSVVMQDEQDEAPPSSQNVMVGPPGGYDRPTCLPTGRFLPWQNSPALIPPFNRCLNGCSQRTPGPEANSMRWRVSSI